MAGVTGVGGVFFRSKDPEALYAWYERHLGINREADGSVTFLWGEGGMTVWAIFPHDTDYFGKRGQSFMLNFRVDDLDALLRDLEAAGVEIDPDRQSYPFGKFAWITDPDGNRVELWQPLESESTDSQT